MESASFAAWPGVLSAVFVGGCLLLLAYILKSFRGDHEQADRSEPSPAATEKKKESAALKQKKKQAWSRGEQAFADPWLVKTLKNHSGPVLGVDYSSSGKYLASCGEEEPEPEDLDMNSSSGSECNKENGEPPSAPPKGLSRRQRKNRRREDSPPEAKKKREARPAAAQRVSERVFAALLHPHLLTPDQLFAGGYPVQSGNAVVFFSSGGSFRPPPPRRAAADSDEGSGSEPEAAPAAERAVERACVRCGRGFFVAGGEYLTQERCVYHWGKPLGAAYACCGAAPGAPGCATCKLHVWGGAAPGLNGPLAGFVRTRPRRLRPADGFFGVYALDCEMCYTVEGLELARVTVVAVDGRLVYDAFVRPRAEVVDYNTRFSGITAKDLGPGAKSLKEVQNDLRGFISAETILIGHALDNDLRALKLVHRTVVDTAMSFPHYQGFPYRRSLKQLVASYLKQEVQAGPHGHNSYEDARASMELMKYRVRKENRGYVL